MRDVTPTSLPPRDAAPGSAVRHHHQLRPGTPVQADDLSVRLNPIETGLLIDAAVPWFPNLVAVGMVGALLLLVRG